MNSYEPKVTIILVNFNGWLDTIECLESLVKLEYSNFNIIVVDNASTNNSYENIIEWARGNINYNFNFNPISKKFAYPPEPKPINFICLNDNSLKNRDYHDSSKVIFLYQSFVNTGFAGGNNVGTCLSNKLLSPEFIWYLNNDTVVKPDSLKKLVNFYFKNKCNLNKIGIIGSKLLFYHKPDKIQAIGGKYNPFLGLTKHIGENEIDKGQYDFIKLNDIDYIVGASMFVSKDYLENVGYMDPDYFLYFEELDWILRGEIKGYKILFCPESTIFHKEGASSFNNEKLEISFLSDYLNKRNRILITKRFFPSYLPLIYFSFIGVILNRIYRKQYNRIIPFINLLFGKGINKDELFTR